MEQLAQHLPTKHGLTQRQREIFEFLQNFISTHDYSPSYREIMTHFSFSSSATVHKHISILKRKGFISVEKNSSRSISVPVVDTSENNTSSIELPFMGHISEGMPIETSSHYKTISIPRSLVHNLDQSYVLQIRGDSLMEEHMANGDLIIVEARQEANSGETIIATVGSLETLIKLYYPQGDYVKLDCSNPNYQPLIVRNEALSIQGVLSGLLRMY
ncbi:MAG: repressor LexA [Chlamydiales bacterium]|jgi:repressor LexA